MGLWEIFGLGKGGEVRGREKGKEEGRKEGRKLTIIIIINYLSFIFWFIY